MKKRRTKRGQIEKEKKVIGLHAIEVQRKRPNPSTTTTQK